MSEKETIETYQEKNTDPSMIDSGCVLHLAPSGWEKIEIPFLVSCVFDGKSNIVRLSKKERRVMDVFEVCVYSDCKKDLKDLFERRKQEVVCSFAKQSRCPKIVLITASNPSVLSTKDDKKNNHNGKWQKFAMFRMGGGK